MRKGFLVLGLLVAGFCQAQKQGQLIIGGAVGLDIANSKTDAYTQEVLGVEVEFPEVSATATTWSVAPEVGYFLEKDLMIGMSLSVASLDFGANVDTEDTTAISSDASSITFGTEAYIRKFYKLGKGLHFYTGASIGYARGNLSASSTITGAGSIDQSADLNIFGVNANMGLFYQIHKKFSIVARYGVLGFTRTSLGPQSVNNFGLGVSGQGPAFNVGVYYTLLD